MDVETAVFNASRDGNLGRLKVYLQSWRSEEELAELMNSKVFGATPLLIACRNGHYDVAEYLIERCKADIEQPGSVTFDGDTIEGAPPLWVAAASGHMSLVRLLVKAGASVNSTTKTLSTPLRAACFDGHLHIVKYLVDNGADIEMGNRHGHTCLMIACYKGHHRIAKYLLAKGAKVNRRSVKGNTALHDCAESGSLSMLKLLLEHGAKMDVDSYGMTPLLAASVSGHSHIVEHLITSEPALVSRQQRIDAMELLGATYVDKNRDMVGALTLWKAAMDDRFPSDSSAPLPKPQDVPRIEAYDFTVEASNHTELEELLADPDAMRMQALVIRERILGPAHPDTSYYLRHRGAVYADAGRYRRCRQLWHHALDMQRTLLPPLSPLTHSSLQAFAELFAFMRHERNRPPHRGRMVPPVTIEEVYPVYTKALSELSRGCSIIQNVQEKDANMTNMHKILVVVLQLTNIIATLLQEQECSPEMKRQIYTAVHALVKLNVKVKKGRSALHVACCESNGLNGGNPGAAAELLLRLGHEPDLRDADGNTALHLLAILQPFNLKVFRKMVECGIHLDTVNYKDATALTLLRNKAFNDPVNPLHYTKLTCLAAKVVREYNIPFRDTLPVTLHSLVLTH